MNLSAINAAELNGSNEVWSWYGSSSVVAGSSLVPALQLIPGQAPANIVAASSGEAIYGRSGSGVSQILLSADGDGTRRTIGEGAAFISFAADGIGALSVFVSGAAQISLLSDAEGLRMALGEGASVVSLASSATGILQLLTGGESALTFGAEGDGTRRTFGEGYSAVDLDASGIGVLLLRTDGFSDVAFVSSGDGTRRVIGQGESIIVVSPSLEYRIAQAGWLEAAVAVAVASSGGGHLVIDAPSMIAPLAFGADGEPRLGGRLLGEGNAILEVYSRGTLGFRHYVYAEGSAAIQIQARTERAGIPPIPNTYIAAPATRSLQVNNEPRLFTVPAERRL